MTILQYITPSRLGGAEIYFLCLVQSLRLAGHRVIVVTKRDAALREEVERLAAIAPAAAPPLEIHAWHTHGKIDPHTLGKLCRLIRREKVEVIHTHLTTASWMGSLAGRLTGVPVVARVPATDSKTFFQRATYLVAVSQGVKRHLIEQGVPARKIHVLYNGIDLERFREAPPAARAKADLGLPPEARTVGIVASLSARKGHRFLLEALAQIAAGQGAGQDAGQGAVHALFAGEGKEEAALRAQAATLGLGEQVHFLGFRRDVVPIMAACDVVALPSLKEGLSNAVMEAMALRRPVVATAIAGMPEVVRDEETGLLVAPRDVPGLAGALQRLLNDPAWAQQLGRNGRRFLEENFDQKQCLAKVERFLCRVGAAGRGGSREMDALAATAPIAAQEPLAGQ